MRQLDPCPKCGKAPVLLRTPKIGESGYNYSYACLACNRASRWLVSSIATLEGVTYEWNYQNDYELDLKASWKRMVRKGVWVTINVAKQKKNPSEEGQANPV